MISLEFSFSNMMVCCVCSLESPHRGDSNESKQHTLSIEKRKPLEIIPNTIMLAVMGCLLGTQERVQNSRGKRAINVRATEVLL